MNKLIQICENVIDYKEIDEIHGKQEQREVRNCRKEYVDNSKKSNEAKAREYYKLI